MDLDVDRARLRTTLSYRVHPRLQLGIEFNPEVDEVTPLATLFLLTENERRPALFLGTSSDRIGSPEGTQSYYLTASKRFGLSPVSGYLSLNYSEWDAELNLPFGVVVHFSDALSLRPMYDGAEPHLMLTWAAQRWSVSLLAVELEHPGISVAWGF